jgi:hypothetical protein
VAGIHHLIKFVVILAFSEQNLDFSYRNECLAKTLVSLVLRLVGEALLSLAVLNWLPGSLAPNFVDKHLFSFRNVRHSIVKPHRGLQQFSRAISQD